jgi:hypothetical protein
MAIANNIMLFKNKQGQSLVELIVAVAVIEIGLFSVWSLFLVNFNAEREAEMRIVGVNLAREGVEVVKNIRDSNWLKSTYNIIIDSKIWPWDENLNPGDYSVNYDSLALESADWQDIYFNKDGFFSNIESDQKTPYRRLITLKSICCLDSDMDLKCDDSNYSIIESDGNCSLKVGVNVVSLVTWSISGKPRRVILEDNLYNWR